jgi:lipopolysaccharide export system protein LptC
MARPDNLYSRFVRAMKIVLPLTALGLLSTMFLFAGSDGPTGDIPYAEIAEIAQDARISDPRFAGVAADGSVIEVTADRITPEPETPDAFRVFDIRASVTDTAGATVNVSAGEGSLNGRTRLVTMTGLARLDTSTGYQMETTGLTADLAAGTLITDGALEVRAPFGALTAGRLAVSAAVDGGGQRLVFTDGVRLLYDPQE